MKFAVIFITALALVSSTPVQQTRNYDPREDDMYRTRYLLLEDEKGNLYTEDLFQEVSSTRASVSDVTLYLFTRNNQNSPNIIASNGVDSLPSTNFLSSRPNVFLIHGWNNNYQSDVITNIRPAVLSALDANVFVVDWSSITNGLYTYSFSQVQSVGDIVGDFIVSVMNRYNVGSSNFYLIGHSLGAHVSGCAGARVRVLSNSLVNSIVGLDPAGPLFSSGNIDNRIDPTDGDFVQVIHTNGGILGYYSALGHADYYPNGGSSQPGCGIDLVGTCAHGRAYEYYAESILSSGFRSHACSSSSNYNDGNCYGNHQSYMGLFYIDKSASGDYYLNTNSGAPYALG